MRAVLPGKPSPKLQAVCTGQWAGHRLIAYISGNALVILSGPDSLLQTIYRDEPDQLQSVALDEASGKLATCSKSILCTYRPYGEDECALKWSLEEALTMDVESDIAPTLSWGSSEELLLGGKSLRLLATTGPIRDIWTSSLPSPVKLALFSHDASFVASTGFYDRLAKIWRRRSFGSDDVRFDYSYLAHPTTVTGFHWREPRHKEQTIDNVLYTQCADNILRVWVASDPHGLQLLQLWAQVDLQESIKPRLSSITPPSRERYAFIIDSRDFCLATERAVQNANDEEKGGDALNHIIEIAHRSPEVCVVLDDEGHMSAWGFENVGCKDRKTSNVFNITHGHGVKLASLSGAAAEERHVSILNFSSVDPSSDINVLAHHFDGRIEWLVGPVAWLFDSSPRKIRLKQQAVWSGHDAHVKKMIRTAQGTALVSHTQQNECFLWKQKDYGNEAGGTSMIRQSVLAVEEHIHRTCVLKGGDLVVFLHYGHISLWDARTPRATRLASLDYRLKGKPLCLIILPQVNANKGRAYVATISSEMKGVTWEIQCDGLYNGIEKGVQASMREFDAFDLGGKDDLAFCVPVDPAGSSTTVSHSVDAFSSDVAISCTTSGTLHTWAAAVDRSDTQPKWLLTATVDTRVDRPSLVSASSIRKTALVDSEKTSLTVWDTRSSQLEFERTFEAQDTIRDLDWTSTPDNQSLLAVGFPYRVLMLAQLRFDYLDAGPAWTVVRSVSTRDLSPTPIGDSTWLSGGSLVVGAGHQFFIYDKQVEITGDLETDLRLRSHHRVSWNIFDVVAHLNGPLPFFHPQFLAQCILCGKGSLVQRIIIALYKKLKFYSDGDELDGMLGISLEDFYREEQDTPLAARKELGSSFADFVEDEDDAVVSEDLATSLNEKLAQIAIPQLSSTEQFHLADIVECVATVEKQRRSMDDNAARFLLFFRQHMLRKRRTTAVNFGWREITWAFHSSSQDILIDLVCRHFQSKLRWEHARESGMFMWISDITAMRAQFEIIARNHYTQTDEKNPIDCSLYYLALRKKNVLLQLWRMAGWNREQKSTQKLLANNFEEARWKTAALKNAYALLSRHRFEYAAAFFLLADCLRDAVAVCVNQLGDLQLGIAVARVYEGDDGPVFKEILEDRLLPLAATEGNRWMASWAFWMLKRRDMAVRALISPVYTLVDTPSSPNLRSQLFLVNDPALVVLYKQLRERTLQTLRGASKIAPRVEWEFLLHNARLYDRMGCDVLALDLVRNWEFFKQLPELTGGNNPANDQSTAAAAAAAAAAAVDPRKMLRRRSSLVVADLPSPTESRHPASDVGLQKSPPLPPPAPPPGFEEPSASSLLDSFGF
ncbi:MAG: hypothetical protein M1825_002504 [Sarcosagium campestre]|nr:MAG: hypothetical protein M1825_002504 [Sarcosagium campestre]